MLVKAPQPAGGRALALFFYAKVSGTKVFSLITFARALVWSLLAPGTVFLEDSFPLTRGGGGCVWQGVGWLGGGMVSG